jgi:LysM repeat protein
MLKFFTSVLIAALLSVSAFAQDSLFVINNSDNDGWILPYRAKHGETLFSIARLFNVPPATLISINKLTYEAELKTGQALQIPVGSFNQLSAQPANGDARPLYYRVLSKDNLFRISRFAGVQQRIMQGWNGLSDNNIEGGQVLMVGWIVNNPPQTQQNATNAARLPIATPPAKNIKVETEEDDNDGETIIVIPRSSTDTIPPVVKTYLSQTNNEQNVVEEKGTAVFFDMQGGLKKSKTLYAFHNTAKKGTIIKVFNPGKDKVAYVKVLGPIPDTKQYHNSIIGISEAAKAALDVSDDRMWCELKFAGY